MKKMALALFVVLLIPSLSNAGKSPMKFIAKKHIGNDQMFLYRCNSTGNVFEVYRHYNSVTKLHELKFIVNGHSSDWIEVNDSPEIFEHFAIKSCEESVSKYVTLAK